MKRATKRRLGIAGMIVAGMLVVMFLVSTRFLLWANLLRQIDLQTHQLVMTFSAGNLEVYIPYVWEFKGTWSFYSGSKTFSQFQVSFSWPKFQRSYYWARLLLPLWIPPLLILIPSFLLWWGNRKPPEGHCECGYNLTGNVSGVCPECGRNLKAKGDNDITSDEDSSN